MIVCPPIPDVPVVTDQRSRAVLGGNHHDIRSIDRNEVVAAFGDSWYEDWDEDRGDVHMVKRKLVVYSGRVSGIGLRVYRKMIVAQYFWLVACELPLGDPYQAWSRAVIQKLCPSVVWSADHRSV